MVIFQTWRSMFFTLSPCARQCGQIPGFLCCRVRIPGSLSIILSCFQGSDAFPSHPRVSCFCSVLPYCSIFDWIFALMQRTHVSMTWWWFVRGFVHQASPSTDKLQFQVVSNPHCPHRVCVFTLRFVRLFDDIWAKSCGSCRSVLPSPDISSRSGSCGDYLADLWRFACRRGTFAAWRSWEVGNPAKQRHDWQHCGRDLVKWSPVST